MISVIVSVYNVEKYVVNCLKSIVNQDYADFELIIVDDGSTDDSVKVIKDYLSHESVKWELNQKENGGQSSTRNAGLKKANGEYVVFIDSDDVISSDFLLKLKEAIEADDYDFSFCNFKFVNNQETPISNKNQKCIYNTRELLEAFMRRTINFVVPSMMFRRSFLNKNKINFDERIRFSEDQIFIWDVIINSKKSIYLAKEMYGYYLREKSIMTSSPYQKIMNGFEVYKEFTNRLNKEFSQHSDIIKYILPRWELGTLYTAAKLVNYNEFLAMYKEMNGRVIIKEIIGINETKAYLLAMLSMLSPKLLYLTCGKMK